MIKSYCYWNTIEKTFTRHRQLSQSEMYPGNLISNLEDDGGGGGGMEGDGGGVWHLFKEALIWRGWLFNFSQIVSWHDHFSDTSAHKHQHKLFIDVKSLSLSLNRGTISTYCVQSVYWMCSQTETMYKSKTTWQKLYILCCLITRPQNGGEGRGAYSRGGAYFKFGPIGGALIWRGC